MSETTYSCGDNSFSRDNRNYAFFNTVCGKETAEALDFCGVPFVGTFTDSEMRIAYDNDYNDTVDEIAKKSMSGGYAVIREIREQNSEDSYLRLLTEVARHLHITEGTLRERPNEVCLSLCKCYADLWLCDTPTIQRELSRYLPENVRVEEEQKEAKLYEYQQNNTPEKRETVNLADIQHRQNVLMGDEDHNAKADMTAREEARTGLISREVIRRQAEMIRRKQAVKQKLAAEKDERERKF